MLLEERTQYAAMQIEYETVKNKLAKYTLLEKTIEVGFWFFLIKPRKT